jgi:hypothetical protein
VHCHLKARCQHCRRTSHTGGPLVSDSRGVSITTCMAACSSCSLLSSSSVLILAMVAISDHVHHSNALRFWLMLLTCGRTCGLSAAAGSCLHQSSVCQEETAAPLAAHHADLTVQEQAWMPVAFTATCAWHEKLCRAFLLIH